MPRAFVFRAQRAKLVMVLMIQLIPNTTDIRLKFPTMVYQAVVDR